MKLSPHSSKDGFSLIEVLIALLILVIVIVGGGAYFFYGRVGIKREEYRRVALELASQRLEELKAMSYSSTDLEEGETDKPTDNLPSGTITTDVVSVDSDYKKVKVTVSWGDNPDNKVELVTLIAPCQA